MKIEITNPGKWYQSLTIKLILLGFLGVVFLIPLEMIKSVILERQGNAENARKEIASQWAGKQYVTGPVLNIPVRTVPAGKDEKAAEQVWHILPEVLAINGTINPEIRYRSIYRTVVYGSDIRMQGEFILPADLSPEGYELMTGKAYFTAGISDNRGLKGSIVLRTGSGEIMAEPGSRDQDLFPSGITFNYPLSDDERKIEFDLKLSLSGSEGLFIVPAGKTTIVQLESEWTSPSFSGSFLPVNRQIDEKGFRAGWEVTHLNRNFPQHWKGAGFNTEDSAFGVDLFLPVDHYQKSWRSARYGILFIALTFLVLIFLEIRRRENIHIFHYFLVSLGLVLFFSLLNSLSEHAGFGIAYLVSSAATAVLITLFTGTLFSDRKTALIVLGMLSGLYVFIYILLTLNDFAYLAGNIGLFILLAVVMFLSSKMKVFMGEKPSEDDTAN